MKKLILLLALLFTAREASATFSQVQAAKVNTSCNATASCAVTVTSTGSGNIGVVAIASNANMTITSVTGGGTWTLCGSTCQTGDATAGWVDIAYTLSTTSGATTITINHTSIANNSVGMFWEWSSTLTPSFDNSNKALQTTNCTSCTGASLTIGGSNDIIFTTASCGGTCSAITTYTADPSTPWPGGDGMAHLANTASGTAPSWTQSPTSHLATASLAIKESSGVVIKPPVIL